MNMKDFTTFFLLLFVKVDRKFDEAVDCWLPNHSIYSWIIIWFYCSFYIFIVVSSVIILWFHKRCGSGITPLHESITGSLYQNNIRLSFVLAIPLFLDVFFDYLSLRWVEGPEKNKSKQIVHSYTRFSLLAILVLPKLLISFIDFGTYSAEAYIVLNAYKLGAINGAFMAYIAEIDAVSRSESMIDLNVGRTCLLVLFTCAPAHYVGLLWSILDKPFYSKNVFSIAMFFYVLRFYGFYRGISMLWKWWQRLQIRGGFLLVWFLITLSSLWHGCYWNIFNTTPVCLSTYVILCLAFFLLALMLPSRINRMETIMEIKNMQKDTQDRQAFIRYISHEIRTPLNTTFLGLEFINTSLDQLSGRPFFKGNRAILPGLKMEITPILETVGDIRSSCEIALGILNELLMFDKMTTGKMTLDVEIVNARQYISSVVQPFHVNARQSDVAFTMDCEMGVPWKHLTIEVDVNKMGQVVRNLISNALKFTPKGGRVVVKLKTFEVVTTTTTTSSANQPSASALDDKNITAPLKGDVSSSSETETCTTVPWLVLEVTDTGAGISEENQKKLFGQYVQFNASKLQKGGGSGLGLWISRGICELHGGRIGGRSDGEGKGSTFFLELPVNMHVPPDHTKSIPSGVNESPVRAPSSETNNHPDNNASPFAGSITPSAEFSTLLNQDSKSDVNIDKYDDQLLAAGITEASSKCHSRVGSTVGSGTSSPKIVSGISTPISNPLDMMNRQDTNSPTNDDTISLQFLSSELEKRLVGDGIGVRHDNDAVIDSNGSTSTNGIQVQVSHNGQLAVGQTTALRLARAINRGSLTNSGKNHALFSNQSSTPNQTPPIASTRVSSRTVSRQASNPSSRIHSRAASPSSRDGSNEEDFLSSAASFMQVNRQNAMMSRLSSGYPSRLTSPDMSMHNISALSSRIGSQYNSGNNTARSVNDDKNDTTDSTVVPADRTNSTESSLKSQTITPSSSFLVAERMTIDANYSKKDLSSSGKSSISNKSLCQNASIMLSTTKATEDESTLLESSSRQLRFLVVDDTALTRKMVRRLLEFQNYLVLEATDGGDALVVYDAAKERGETIDCILMDYSMPVLCGSDATAALREKGYQGLVVGCTGLTAASDVQDFMNKGANAVLSKPLRFDALHAMVKDLI